MLRFNMLMAIILLLGLSLHLNDVAQLSAVAPPSSWKISNMQLQRINMHNVSSILPILDHRIMSYRTYFGFYTIDGHSFILSIVIFGPQAPVIWSANPDNPVNRDVI